MSYGRFTWIIGLDPGLSTGLFVVSVDSSGSGSGNPVHVQSRFQGAHEVALMKLEEVVRYAATWREQVLIAGERYTTTDRTGKRSAQPLPQRVLGAAEQLTYSYTNAEFILQSPADAKKLAPNEFLRDAGFYSRGEDVGCRDANDVNDAARHVLLALARKRASVFDVIVSAVEQRRGHSQR